MIKKVPGEAAARSATRRIMSVTFADGREVVTMRRIRRVTFVKAREMVSGPCTVSAQCLRGEA